MLLIDALIRYPTVALLLLVGVLCIRDGNGKLPARFAALLSFSIAAMLLGLSQEEFKLPIIPLVTLHILSLPNIVFVWWLGLSMFQEDFKLQPLHWLVCITWVVIGIVDRLLYFNILSIQYVTIAEFGDFISFSMMANLAYIALSGHSNDLIEPRRRLRLYFVLALVIGTLSILYVEEVYYPNFEQEVTLFRAVVILPLVLWGILWLTHLKPEKLLFQASKKPEAENANIDPRDQLLKDQLIGQMNEGKAYLNQSLTIRSLAELINTPEHRLRALINQGLGFRNFSDFLNSYRISEVKLAFQEPENTRTPVLTIAMNAGYNSLATFNRAFQKSEAMTPSQYRQNLLNSTDQT